MQFCSLPVDDPLEDKVDNEVKFSPPLNSVEVTETVSPINTR